MAHTRYWPVEVDEKDLEEFIQTRAELMSADEEIEEIPLILGDHKFHGWPCGDDLLLVFVTDTREDEHAIFERMEKAAKSLKNSIKKLGLEETIEKYEKIIEPSVITRLKIALVGEGGVGKTTTLHLLLGDTPPTQYVPTIALNLETVENIRFGNYSLVLWDFAGQERFRNLWRFYFHGADVIFLVCDSTLRNVLISKDILKLIKRDAPKVPVFALANKQDLPNAMKPEVIQKILGIPTYPMVAIDKERRDEMLRILMNAAAQYVGVALPDLPTSELLKFSEEAAEQAAATPSLRASSKGAAVAAETGAIDSGAEDEEEDFGDIEVDDLETIEIVEEVLVDEEGHVIDELSDEYEVVEEVVEEVDEGVSVSEGQEPVSIASAEETSMSEEEGGVASSREIAKAIISERLDADEIIEEELEQAPDDALQSALEALSSDEVPANHSEMPPPVVREEEKEELTKILGLLDDKAPSSEEEDELAPTSVRPDEIEDFTRVLESPPEAGKEESAPSEEEAESVSAGEDNVGGPESASAREGDVELEESAPAGNEDVDEAESTPSGHVDVEQEETAPAGTKEATEDDTDDYYDYFVDDW